MRLMSATTNGVVSLVEREHAVRTFMKSTFICIRTLNNPGTHSVIPACGREPELEHERAAIAAEGGAVSRRDDRTTHCDWRELTSTR